MVNGFIFRMKLLGLEKFNFMGVVVEKMLSSLTMMHNLYLKNRGNIICQLKVTFTVEINLTFCKRNYAHV